MTILTNEFLKSFEISISGFDDSQTLPPEIYTSEEFFRKEAECMWTRVWQFACRVEDIPNVGDSLVYDILDWSFVLVRSSKDKISAY